MKNYDPLDWYWLDAAGERVYASARQAIVPINDPAYFAWCEDGTKPTAWPTDEAGKVSDAELQAVLDDVNARYRTSLVLPVPAGLIRYAEAKQAALATGGYAYNVAPAGQPAKVAFADTDTVGRINLNGLVSLAQLDEGFTTIWVQAPENLTLGAGQITALGVAVGTFYSATYKALATVVGQIRSGAIKSRADVDAAAAWPATSG